MSATQPIEPATGETGEQPMSSDDARQLNIMTDEAQEPSPRPWSVVGYEPGWLQISDANGNLIAMTECSDGLDEPTDFPERANANLIATAVNSHATLVRENEALREGLQRIVDAGCARASCHYRRKHDDDCHVALARAALGDKQ